MKKTTAIQRWFSANVFALVMAGAVGIGQAQTFTNIVVSGYDTASDPHIGMVHWWGGDLWTIAWDGTQNCPDPLVPAVSGSGALKFTLDWSDTSGNSGFQQPQFAFLDGINGGGWNTAFNVANGTPVNGFFYDLDFDFKFDPASARSANNGTFGNVQVGLAMPGWSQLWVYTGNGVTNQDWTHVHAYIDPTLPNISQIGGITVMFPWQTSTGNTNAFYTNASQVTTMWIDNLVFKTNLSKPLTPPTLALKPVTPVTGLSIQTTASAGTYDRDSIATVSSQYSWVGSGSTPVTYSVTVAKYPGTNNPNFQTHIFLASGNGTAPGTESSPDWNEPNCIFLQIQNNADGSASARFMYKTNDANANDQLWGPNGVAVLNDPAGVVGTWSISFLNDTNVTLKSPGGLSTNFNFADSTTLQTYFPQGTVVAYFGCQPNAAGNVGQGAVLSEVKISGLTPAIDDKFTGPTLDLNTWRIAAAQPAGVTVSPNDVHWSLAWTLPDLYYELQSAASVTGPWTDVTQMTNAVQSGTSKTLGIPDSTLPGQNASYYRMIKRSATKLQILLPGETAAPGTPTGKTGTPTPQTAGSILNVVVNAVDDNWNVVPSFSDTVSVSTTDPGATDLLGTPLPITTGLSQGTRTLSIMLVTPGAQTLTATDTTKPSVTASTSAPVTIQ